MATVDREVEIFGRALAPDHGDWSPDIARAIMTISLSPQDRERMNRLATKAREGNLSCDEELEIESYRQVSRLIEWMRAKARISIAQSTARVS